MQLEEMIRRFVVASDDDGEHWSATLSRVVFVEVAEVAVSAWYGHAVEVVLVADSLDEFAEGQSQGMTQPIC